MSAATVESTYYTDPNAAGFLSKAAFGATIIPFEVTIATTSLDDIGDVVKILPLVAKGGRNRLIAVLFYCEDLDDGATLDADLTVLQNGAHTIIHNAGAGFQSATGTATAPLIILPFLALDDTEGDGIADLCFYVNAAAGTPAEGVLTGLAIYE